MNHLPSAKDRKVARVKEDLTEDGFRRVKPLFWKGVKGWIKVLLPAWNLPDDKVLKKLFSLSSGPFEGQMLKEQVPLMITPWLQRISSKPSNRRNCSISFVSGCVASMSTSFTSADSPTFECKVDWAQTRKARLPEFSSKVRTFIAHCWQEGIAGRAKVSADAVVVRLTEEYLAGNICLAELPVVGQVRTSYQSIGQSKDEASKSPRKKAGCDKPQRKKQKTSNATFDWSKPLLKWSKPQLQTYLAEHNLCTSGNKPELIERVQACMNTNECIC